MTCSQRINLIMAEDKSYDDDIIVTDVPKGYYIAVTQNDPPVSGSATREIKVEILQGGEWADGGTSTISSGVYIRQNEETEIKVTVIQDGTMKCENTTAY